MDCFWVKKKRCPYLDEIQSNGSVSDGEGMRDIGVQVTKKNLPMLSYFTVGEICTNCLNSIRIIRN